MARRKREKLHATGDKQCFGTDQKCIRSHSYNRCDGCVDATIRAGGNDFDLSSDRGSRCLQFCDIRLCDARIVGIDEHSKARSVWQQLVQERKPLCPELHANVVDSGRIAARSIETGNEADLYRVRADDEGVLIGVTITATRRWTRSAANAERVSLLPSAHR